jgi:hypothetical protein
MPRVDSFYSGQVFGLPAKVRSVPFGQESKCSAELGLTEAELECAVALIAAEFVQMGPVTARQVGELVSYKPQHPLYSLAKKGFAVAVARNVRELLYVPTPKAWRELGFNGWSLLKETA